MLTPDHLATIRAALKYWKDEICPYGMQAMKPYLDSVTNKSIHLSSLEVLQLSARFEESAVRYAVYDAHEDTMSSTEVFSSISQAQKNAVAEEVATLIRPA